MNKYVCYSVKDVVAGQFSEVKIFVNEDVAKRWYNGLLKESTISADLQLYKVGTFDIITGEIVPMFDFVQGGVVNE